MPNIIYYRSNKTTKDNFKNILKKYNLRFFSSASLYEGFLNELFELNKIFSLIFDSDSKNESLPAKVSLPKSENSLIQLFELLFILKNNKVNLQSIIQELSSDNCNIFSAALDIVRSTDIVDCALVGMEDVIITKQNVELLGRSKIDSKIIKEYWNKTWTS